MPKLCGIYKLTQLSTGKVYIGQSTDLKNRQKAHRGAATVRKGRLQQAFLESGAAGLEFTILELCQPEELDSLEIKYIALYDSSVSGLNMTCGARRGCTVVAETRETLSKSLHKRYADPTYVEKYQAARTSETAIANAREAALARFDNPETLAAHRERQADPANRQKMSEGRRLKETYRFKHLDGREVEATLWEMTHLHGANDNIQAMMKGKVKHCKGWSMHAG